MMLPEFVFIIDVVCANSYFCRKTGLRGMLMVYDSSKARFIHSWCVISAWKVLSICKMALISSFLGGNCTRVAFLFLRCRFQLRVCFCEVVVNDAFVIL